MDSTNSLRHEPPHMRTSLSVPEEILEEFDETWEAEEIESRSRAVRKSMLEYIESHRELEKAEGRVAAFVVYSYSGDAAGETHDVQHDFQEIIETTTHVHGGDGCLENIVCRGDAERVRGLVYRLRDFDDVEHVQVVLQPVS